MATKKRKRTPRAKKSKRTWFKSLIKFGLFVGVLIGVAAFLIQVDRTITKTFEGRRWSVPAQVFAQPLELHQGAKISRAELQVELQRLGYHQDANLPTPGTFKTHNQELQIYLRAFHFMERARQSQRLDIQFRNNQISSISNSQGDVPLIRLDPATIGSFFPSHGEDRLILTPESVPPLLSEGLKAVEDRKFDQHVGFSLRGMLRALLVNLRTGERQQGGSTLTQQLVKSYFLDNRRTIERKLKEVAMAVILELRFTKEDLLTAYINEIFLGQNGNRAIHGFGLGAQFYFNKPISELDASEIATMISIIRGPSYYNPFRHPKRALERRDRILNTFHRDGLIDKQSLDFALAQQLNVVASPTSGGAYYPAFMDKVRAELKDQYEIAALSSQGLRIFTTIKPRFQESAQQAVSNTLLQIEQDRRIEAGVLQAAAIVADTQTGEILALVGGRKGRVDGFNRALNAQRPVGSLIKPIIFLTAIESGMTLADLIVDEPITIQPQHGEPWSPKNFDNKYRGELPLIRALAESLNLATVNLGTQVGLPTIQARFKSFVGHKPNNRYPSFFLGAESLAPIKMLELYGNFASGGFRTPPKAVIAVLDEFGTPITHHPFELQQTIQSDHAATINRALEIVMAKGTGRSSPFSKSGVAGKTGTSNDNRDSWFAGFDNRHVSVVWVGRDDNAITGLTGSSGALRIWNAMARSQSIDPLVHMPSEDLVEIEFMTGMRATQNCADVVLIPVADAYNLPIKPGCNIRTTVGERIKRWFGD
ncbi:MAG: penicillin-binding protein 1B [Gammaproteobacteria bacterium]|nr:penicillin-binding protein 1B [Gammaproteobacteria bacterium]